MTTNVRNHPSESSTSLLICSAIVFLLFAGPLHSFAAPDWRFDIITFCCPCTVQDHVCQPQFDVINWSGANGHYIAMGTDAHRAEIVARGNVLAVYHNDLNTGWTTMTGAEGADRFHQYVVDRFTSAGPAPNWILVNEISAGQWPGNAAYRAWVHDAVHKLKNTYGYNVVLLSPFPNPGRNDADWQAVAEDAYIGIEQYLSGEEIQANGNSVAWCQSQYHSSKNSYIARGVPESKLFLIEHFGQTTSGIAWGRTGVSAAQWDTTIQVRAQAARNIGFAGFISYAWGKNAMEVTDDELIQGEDTYRREPLPSAQSDFYTSAQATRWPQYN